MRVQLLPIHYALIFAFGLVFGSFFNVCIYRWPQEDPKEHEWVNTPSHCPKCGAKIKWYDNIPLFSWLILLRGKCRACKAPISWRYPLVELGNGLLWLLTAWLVANHGFSGVPESKTSWWYLAFAIYFASLYFLTFIIDAETQTIPNEILIGHGIGSILFLWLAQGTVFSGGWLASLFSALGLAALFFLFWKFGAMGDGDGFLALGLGSLFGWPLTLSMLVISVFVGGVLGIGIIIPKMIRKTYKPGIAIAYGPFLVLGSYITMFFGHDLINWYLTNFFPAGFSAGSSAAILLGP